MTYAEAEARILALRGGEYTGLRPGLERIEALLDALGRPESAYTLVQVGGTNGKGSVCSMLAAVLKASGRRVGLYTSPHLVSFRERIRVDGAAIAEDAVTDGVDALGTLFARVDATVFEATTALALDHFAREGVDIAVLEVGLGGRFDATTVGRPALSVVTRIDLDHQQFLGDSLEAIAHEKAGIIRSGVALAAAQAPLVEAILMARATQMGVPLRREGRDLAVDVTAADATGHTVTCRGPGWDLVDLRFGLAGTFQPGNALLAVAAARELGVGEPAIRHGLARARWPGRFQVIAGDPTVVLDGAHNPAGALALADSLARVFPQHAITLVLGVLRDKDAAGIVAALRPVVSRWVVTQAPSRRALAAAELAQHLPAGADIRIASTVGEALGMACGPPSPPIVCVAGSLTVVGEALRVLGHHGDNPCPIENGADSIESLYR